jgi:hypothetical protein
VSVAAAVVPLPPLSVFVLLPLLLHAASTNIATTLMATIDRIRMRTPRSQIANVTP